MRYPPKAYAIMPGDSIPDALDRLGFYCEKDGSCSRIRCTRNGRTYVTTRCVRDTNAWILCGCPDLGGAAWTGDDYDR